MPIPIRILMKGTVFDAELYATICADEIARVLPLEANPSEWGDEFYFEIPVSMPPDETATSKVNAGDIGYWSPGRSLAIFFGPTPMSTGDRPVPASPVNIVGRIWGDAARLRDARGATVVRVGKL